MSVSSWFDKVITGGTTTVNAPENSTLNASGKAVTYKNLPRDVVAYETQRLISKGYSQPNIDNVLAAMDKWAKAGSVDINDDAMWDQAALISTHPTIDPTVANPSTWVGTAATMSPTYGKVQGSDGRYHAEGEPYTDLMGNEYVIENGAEVLTKMAPATTDTSQADQNAWEAANREDQQAFQVEQDRLNREAQAAEAEKQRQWQLEQDKQAARNNLISIYANDPYKYYIQNWIGQKAQWQGMNIEPEKGMVGYSMGNIPGGIGNELPVPQAVGALTGGATGAQILAGQANVGIPSSQWYNSQSPGAQGQIAGTLNWAGIDPREWETVYKSMQPGAKYQVATWAR